MTRPVRENAPGPSPGTLPHASSWGLFGPLAVLAAWLLLVFVPPSYRLQALFAALAALSLVVFAISFRLAARSTVPPKPQAPAAAPADPVPA